MLERPTVTVDLAVRVNLKKSTSDTVWIFTSVIVTLLAIEVAALTVLFVSYRSPVPPTGAVVSCNRQFVAEEPEYEKTFM